MDPAQSLRLFVCDPAGKTRTDIIYACICSMFLKASVMYRYVCTYVYMAVCVLCMYVYYIYRAYVYTQRALLADFSISGSSLALAPMRRVWKASGEEVAAVPIEEGHVGFEVWGLEFGVQGLESNYTLGFKFQGCRVCVDALLTV